MKSKAYVKKGALPMAPAPTRPVRSETIDGEIERDIENGLRFKKSLHCFSPEFITDEQRARAARSRNENLANAWTYEEVKKLKQMYRSGMSRKEIVNGFPNRSSEAVGSKLRKMIKKGEI